MQHLDSIVQKQPGLARLGFDEAFIESTSQDNPFSYARITEVNRGNYKISNGVDESIAELSGKFLFSADESLDYPTVGDWVLAQFFDNSVAIIHSLLPRKSLLKRLDPGKAVSYQLIASNLDAAFIVQSVNANFDINRLERYLVMVHEAGIQPIILLTKTDLLSEDVLTSTMEQIKHSFSKYPLYAISSLSGDGVAQIEALLEEGKTYSLLGSSGVGKTTLINRLIGEELYEVKEIREKDDKGKHTTTRRQLIMLSSGVIIIDTPGMRELGNFTVETGIEETFDTIGEYAKQCKFKDCSHTNEKGCAILKALEDGDISQEQFDNFSKIQKESAFYEMTVLDRKKRDKQFGAHRKNFLRSHRKK